MLGNSHSSIEGRDLNQDAGSWVFVLGLMIGPQDPAFSSN